MLLTVVIAFFAGLAFRKRFRGEGVLFTVAVASLIVPSIVVSLGIGLEFRLLDEAVKWAAAATGGVPKRRHDRGKEPFPSVRGHQSRVSRRHEGLL